MTRGALLVATLVVLVGAAPARASTVEIVGGSDAIHYVAAPGERNDLTFHEIEDSFPTGFLVTDPGAPVTAGAGCVAVDEHSAACISDSGSMYHLQADLGDEDDILRPAGFNLVTTDGGPGDDVLLGGTWDDRLDGGGGTDQLRGGEGRDVLLDGDGAGPDADVIDGGPGLDWVDYRGRAQPVVVDLADPAPDGSAGEGDTLLSIENVQGGAGDDRLTGDGGPNVFRQGGGEDRIAGKGGRDLVRKARAGRLDCGRGPDIVRGVTRRTYLGPSCETIIEGGVDNQFTVLAQPRPTRSGMELALRCGENDGEPLHCSGTARVTASSRTLARGTFARGSRDRTVRLTLTAAGRRLLSRRAVIATVALRGTAMPDLAWRVTLARR
jgi:Ca2+-binding RTX toxin-like protein